MDSQTMEKMIRNIDRRTRAIEQILPTLATRAELKKAIAPLATKAELKKAIAPLATKAELKEEGERTRRHMDVLAEAMRDQVRVIAEGHDWLASRVVDHDGRITRLEDERDTR